MASNRWLKLLGWIPLVLILASPRAWADDQPAFAEIGIEGGAAAIHGSDGQIWTTPVGYGAIFGVLQGDWAEELDLGQEFRTQPVPAALRGRDSVGWLKLWTFDVRRWWTLGPLVASPMLGISWVDVPVLRYVRDFGLDREVYATDEGGAGVTGGLAVGVRVPGAIITVEGRGTWAYFFGPAPLDASGSGPRIRSLPTANNKGTTNGKIDALPLTVTLGVRFVL